MTEDAPIPSTKAELDKALSTVFSAARYYADSMLENDYRRRAIELAFRRIASGKIKVQP